MIDDYEKLGDAFAGNLDFSQAVYTIEWLWDTVKIKEHKLSELAANANALDDIAHDEDAPIVYFTRSRAEEELIDIMEAHQ